MSFIFEYGEWIQVAKKIELQSLLQAIWNQQLAAFDGQKEDDNEEYSSSQAFLRFDGDKVRANNYVGFIQSGDELIEIYPKVFRRDNCSNKHLMLRHIFYWFKYCRKWRFPFHKASLDSEDFDNFPELIIHLIATQFYDTLSSQPLMQYQTVEEVLTTPKGSINFNRYINNSLSKGNYHRIECDYEPFMYDNKVNRIIKFCTRMLMGQTRFSENIYVLQESIYILDEVDDIPCTISDVNEVSLNSFYTEYQSLMESCKLIISQQLYSNKDYDLSQWCLLFPMEYIFEDFVAGFLESHFSDKWIVKYQKSDRYLSDEPEAFNMQHDIFLTSRNDFHETIIIDTKYKIRDRAFKKDIKKGIAQSDLYQMVSYAYKRGCKEVFLLYPNISEDLHEADIFNIHSGFAGNDVIKVTAMEIPFWSVNNFELIEDKLMYFFKQRL